MGLVRTDLKRDFRIYIPYKFIIHFYNGELLLNLQNCRTLAVGGDSYWKAEGAIRVLISGWLWGWSQLKNTSGDHGWNGLQLV